MALDLELVMRIHSGYGFHYEIAEDPDTGENIEIRYIEEKYPDQSKTIVLTLDALPAVIEALQMQLAQLKKRGR